MLFASEVRALLATDLIPRRLNPEAVASYLNFGSVSSASSIVQGIESLAPGECFEITLGNTPKVRRFRFQTRTAPRNAPADRAEAVAMLGAALDDSVSRHLISDVPVGLFLSGGVDSSALAAIMAKRLGRPTRSFNVAFTEREFAEGHFAAEIAKQFGAEHSEILLTEDAMLRMMPDAITAMDQPTMDGVNTWVVSKAVRDAGIKVAISGLGGDELFGGYLSFRRALQLERIRLVPRTLRRVAAATGSAVMNGTVRAAKFWEMLASDGAPEAAYTISRRLFSTTETELLAGSMPPELPLPASDDDVVNSVSRMEFTGYMTNTLLRDTDSMSMAHSLEVRVPFVDAEVLDLVLRIPGSWKLDSSRPKPLLLDAVGGVLPESIWRRPKMGFGLPFRKWITSALRPDVDRVLSNGALERTGVNPKAAKAVWSRFCADPDGVGWTRPWSLYVLARWCQVNRVSA
jgi:asparagine synthase (glutamine-hydrolysing)